MRLKLWFFGIYFFGIFQCTAQSCQTLDQILNEFSKTNNELITIKEKLKIQNLKFRISQNKWKPNVKFDAVLPYSKSIESVISGDGNVNFVKRNYLNPLLSVSASKKIPFTGGEIAVTGSLGLFQNFINSNRQYNANWFNIYISQPLFAYNNMKAERIKEKLSLGIDSIQYYLNKELKLKKMVETILEYEIGKQKIKYNEVQIEQANRLLQRMKILLLNGRALADDTLLISYNLNKIKFENEELIESIRTKQEFLSSQLQHIYNYSLCELATLPVLKLDTTQLKQQYMKYGFQKELILDSFEVFENEKKMKKAHGINTSISAGIGANNSSSTFNQLYNTPSQRQNISLNTSIPITGWQSYRYNVEIASIEQQNFQRSKQDIDQQVTLWVKQTYNQYNYYIKSYQLSIKKLSNMETLAKSVYKRYELGKVLYTDYNIVLNEMNTVQNELLDIIKQVLILRFEIRTKTLFDYYLEKEVF
ncbi:MAG: TolC family protein [Chitinophagaceae bacterium]